MKKLNTIIIVFCFLIKNSIAEDLSTVLNIIRNAPENSWIQMNTNLISEAWVPLNLRPKRPSFDDPMAVINAWSSFAWDSNRGDLLLFGGGHANYAGNEVYRWRSSTQKWEIAALPSDLDSQNIPKGGAEYAPQSSHTYDNSVFLPIADRFVTLGGAAYQSGGAFVAKNLDGTLRRTGPYFFDPSKADPNKLGGATGTGVDPNTSGGYMWDNRDIYIKPGFVTAAPSSIEGTADYAYQNGKEVIYISGPDGGGSEHRLARLTIADYYDPSKDTWEVLGINWFGSGVQGAGAYDPIRNLYIKTYYWKTDFGNTPFAFWNLSAPGLENRNRLVTLVSAPTDFIMNGQYGFDYDPLRDRFLLWGTGENVFELKVGNKDGTNWVVNKLTMHPNSVFPPLIDFPINVSRWWNLGVLGKWHYASNLDVFVGLEGPTEGNVWFFKPTGWKDPSPPIDTDKDGVYDSVDNCILLPNVDQLDTDVDNIGNACDPDFNQNGIVDQFDFSRLKACFGKTTCPVEDLNGNGVVDQFDFSRLKAMFGKKPGPSGLVN